MTEPNDVSENQKWAACPWYVYLFIYESLLKLGENNGACFGLSGYNAAPSAVWAVFPAVIVSVLSGLDMHCQRRCQKMGRDE